MAANKNKETSPSPKTDDKTQQNNQVATGHDDQAHPHHHHHHHVHWDNPIEFLMTCVGSSKLNKPFFLLKNYLFY